MSTLQLLLSGTFLGLIDNGDYCWFILLNNFSGGRAPTRTPTTMTAKESKERTDLILCSWRRARILKGHWCRTRWGTGAGVTPSPSTLAQPSLGLSLISQTYFPTVSLSIKQDNRNDNNGTAKQHNNSNNNNRDCDTIFSCFKISM